jgi:NAD(P)-dependent dehydrogenase (short-subunit alcohol dehydrogenase family)
MIPVHTPVGLTYGIDPMAESMAATPLSDLSTISNHIPRYVNTFFTRKNASESEKRVVHRAANGIEWLCRSASEPELRTLEKIERRMRMVSEMFKLDGCCSIITGAGQGLGKYMAAALAEAGSHIVIPDINFEKAREAAGEIGKMGVTSVPYQLDVTKEKDVDAMVDAVVKQFGKIDVLINNAGIHKHINAEKMAYRDWLEVIDVNLNGVFLTSKAVGNVMIKQRKGSIINISSMSGIIVNTPQNQAAYNVSKAGVIMLTKSMAAEWARYNVRVNTIAPGYMNIGVAERYFKEKSDMVTRWLSFTPMGRPGNPDELQGIALYLASEASSFATGAVFSIDGGYTAW